MLNVKRGNIFCYYVHILIHHKDAHLLHHWYNAILKHFSMSTHLFQYHIVLVIFAKPWNKSFHLVANLDWCTILMHICHTCNALQQLSDDIQQGIAMPCWMSSWLLQYHTIFAIILHNDNALNVSLFCWNCLDAEMHMCSTATVPALLNVTICLL